MEENQISLDHVIIDGDLLESLARKLDTLGKPNKADNFTIFPVPYRFHQSMKNLFEPSAVSIGPFHHGRTRVQPMEEQKCRSLWDFLSRGDHITLDLCLSEIKKLEERTRRCYSERVPMDSNSFVEMMLLDGCFVLEYFLKWYERRLIDQYVFKRLSDLLLLENQIPFFIVEKLCEIGLKPEDRMNFTNYLNYIFLSQAAPTDGSIVTNPPAEIHHFIHLCYHSLIPTNPTKPAISPLSRYRLSSFPKSTLIPCATELRTASITLRAKNNPNHMLDISFHHLVLEIPTLKITNESKTLLANLVAFEQCKLDENPKMHANLSSFASFLVSLVNTPEDVKILKECGIVNNCLDSDEELTNFFNQICKGMLVEKDHFMADLFAAVKSYCESSGGKRWTRCNRRKKQFYQHWFINLSTMISLFGGVFLALVLSSVQTYFTVYAYYVPRS
ncbi:UPF0481 protein At3g47200-like [Carex rostrata]